MSFNQLLDNLNNRSYSFEIIARCTRITHLLQNKPYWIFYSQTVDLDFAVKAS